MNLKILLGSAVIAALISGIISYINARRQDNLKYITGERKEWRNAIREISSRLHGASYTETLQILTDLKMRINAYGDRKDSHDYMHDSHIWQIIREIESEKLSNELLVLKQEQLIDYLSLLLKIDWERSKIEVKGNKYYIISCIFFIVTVIYFVIFVYQNNKTKAFFDLATYVGTVVMLVFGAHLAIMYGIKNLCIIIINKASFKYIKNIKFLKQMDSIKLIICASLHVLTVIIPFLLFEIYFSSVKNILLPQTKINIIFLVILYLSGIVFKYSSDIIFINREIHYSSEINKIKTLKEKEEKLYRKKKNEENKK